MTFLRKNPQHLREIFEKIKKDIETVLTTLNVKVLEPADFKKMWSIMEKYGLLPNDALIAATCKMHGIKKIATFDEDFKRVDFLEIFES